MKLAPKLLQLSALGLLLALLASCGTAPFGHPQAPETAPPTSVPATGPPTAAAPDGTATGQVLLRGKSRWVAAAWSELPGFETDALYEAWNAFIRSCERPGPVFAPLCPEVRRLSIGDATAQRAWLQQRLQPYRVESLQEAA